jgi:hypothetical protein
MDDAAVAAGLMAGEIGFLLEQEQRASRLTLEEVHGGRDTDNAAADHHIVEEHLFFPPASGCREV